MSIFFIFLISFYFLSFLFFFFFPPLLLFKKKEKSFFKLNYLNYNSKLFFIFLDIRLIQKTHKKRKERKIHKGKREIQKKGKRRKTKTHRHTKNKNLIYQRSKKKKIKEENKENKKEILIMPMTTAMSSHSSDEDNSPMCTFFVSDGIAIFLYLLTLGVVIWSFVMRIKRKKFKHKNFSFTIYISYIVFLIRK